MCVGVRVNMYLQYIASCCLPCIVSWSIIVIRIIIMIEIRNAISFSLSLSFRTMTIWTKNVTWCYSRLLLPSQIQITSAWLTLWASICLSITNFSALCTDINAILVLIFLNVFIVNNLNRLKKLNGRLWRNSSSRRCVSYNYV